MLKLHALATCFVLAASLAAAAQPSEVPLKVLLAHPQQFNGRRVSFIAYWDTDGHATSLRAGPSADAPRIYCDFEKPRISVKLIESIPHGSWIYVVGTFRYVDMTVRTRSDGARDQHGLWMDEQLRPRGHRHYRVHSCCHASHLTNRSSQPLAVPMSSFHMTSTLNFAAEFAVASGG
jgi:hypothetical protein